VPASYRVTTVATLAMLASSLLCSQAFAIAGMVPDKGDTPGYRPQSEHRIPIEKNILVGKKAPDFTAMTSEGRNIKLSDFSGKFVVLEWHNPDCPFVKKHYDSNNMQTLQNYARSEDVVWLTVNSGGVGKEGYMDARTAQDYYLKHHMHSAHYVIDPKGEVGGLYHAKNTPSMVIIDAGGVIAYTGAIDNIPSADAADVPKARNYVQSALENLLMGKPASPYATQPYGCSVKYKTDP
jgi:hypothetical protein